jgi:hypothetical protein
MASHHDEIAFEDSQTSPSSTGNPALPQGKIRHPSSLNSRMQKDIETSDKGLRDGLANEHSTYGQAVQPSIESSELPSRGKRLFTKYRIFFHLLIWSVMTG